MAIRDTKNILIWILCGAVAIIFIYAGIVKIANPAAFAEQVDNYRILPYFFVSALAVVLPWLELFSGILLLTSRFRAASALILLGLNIIFVIAIISAIIRGLDISCGCFSVEGEGARVGIEKLAEDLVLLVANAFIFSDSVKQR